MADATAEECRAIGGDPWILRLHARLTEQAQTGDVGATQAVAQAYNAALREALKRLRASHG